MRNRHHFILMPIMVFVACGENPRPAGDIQVQNKDSAGVRIVDYSGAPEVMAPFAIADEPVYRHGANPSDYEFQGINVGRLFPDGSAVVADRENSEVVVLSPDGATHRVIARRGQGPGEVTYPYSIFVLGQDSVLVPDNRLVRLTLFVSDSVARIASLPRSSHLGVAGIGSPGELLLMNRTPSRSWTGLEEDEWLIGHMTRFDVETGALDTVASYDHWPGVPPGLPVDPIKAVGEVTVASGHFVYTRSDKPEITWYLPDGRVTQIVRWQAELTRLTEELLEPVEAFERMRNQVSYSHLPDPQVEQFTQEAMGWYYASIGRSLPLYGSPFADAEGRVWLPSYRLVNPQEGSPYTVISSNGDWLGRVEAPPRFRILDVAGGLVLGVVRDEMDVENVVVYRLAVRSSMVG